VAVAVVLWRRRVVLPPPPDSLPLTLDLVAAGLRAGRPLGTALRIAAREADDPRSRLLDRVASLVQLGADPAEAWDVVGDHPDLAAVARVARRSAASGMRLASAFEDLADELRRSRAAAAEARASRAGVWAIAPLGLCFLPAFVCLGVVPVVLGIVRSAFAT
jgi:Flp pilus assembly protein TadB